MNSFFKAFITMSIALVMVFVLCACGKTPQTNDASNYTITFVTSVDGITVAPIVASNGTKISEPTIAEREGYQFAGWYTADNQPFPFTTMPNSDVELTAKWKEGKSLASMHINLSSKEDGSTVDINAVTRADYVNGKISLFDTDESVLLNEVDTEFKGRGNGSWGADKKGYRIKFDKKQSLFGREKSKHWVIIACANFDDKTLAKNALAYNMTNVVFDNVEYTTTTQWLEIYINGNYHGVYLLCEHVRVGEGRVDIASEYGVLDTGYLIEYDAYAKVDTSTGTVLTEGLHYFNVPGLRHAFTVKSPDPEDYAEEVTLEVYQAQVQYIKNYVTDVVNAIFANDFETFALLVDVDSFVDMYILHELFKNVDAGWSSFFMYKKPGGKLYAGPAWDFDATCGNAGRGDAGVEGLYVADLVQTGFPDGANEILIALMQQNAYKNMVITRWNQVSPGIVEFVNDFLSDDFIVDKATVMARNFVLWDDTYQTKAEEDWVRRTKAVRDWLLGRTAWLDGEWALGKIVE